MDLGLAGKAALVTGGSAGLGLGIARALVAEGTHLVVCARGVDRLAAAVDELNRIGRGKAVGVVGDVSVPGEPERIVADAERAVGPLAILVVNAGGPAPGTFLDLREEDWETGYHLTLMSAVRLARAVVPGMKERRRGRIVFVTSISVKQPIPGLLLSNVFRPGVIGLSKSLANELGPFGITANSVCPGLHDTGRIVELFEDRAKRAGVDLDEEKRRALAGVPVGRIGEPIELGRVVAFLASDRASYVTGVSWSVDGGGVQGIFG